MASGLVIHIEFGQDKHTEVVSHDRIRIGAGEDCDLRLPPLAVGTDALLLEIARANGHYRVKDYDHTLAITLNGERLTIGTPIADGDEVRVAESNLAMQFFPVRDLPAVVGGGGRRRQDIMIAPFIENAAIEAAATARRDDAKVFLREFTRELIREINTRTKVIGLLIAVALVGSVFYWGYAAYKEQQRTRRQMAETTEQLRQMQALVDQTKQSLTQVGESNKNILNSMSLAPKLYGDYSNGVFLILCKYELVETGTGRPLRYPEQQMTEDGTTLQNGGEAPILTPDGNGELAQFYSYGTGFYVGGGFVLTNRHVAVEPWQADDRLQALSSSVNARFRVMRLLAYFPGRRQPIGFRATQSSTRDDVAVGVLDAKEDLSEIPVLPLDTGSDTIVVGTRVVLMGFPSGYDRLLANLPEVEARGLQNRYGASNESLLGQLAERSLIKPLTTQGNITDIEGRRIVYDARTAEGGSGAPLFGQSGRVIGVNFALFVEMKDANYAVPAKYAVTLLSRAGWKQEEVPAAPDSNLNATPKDTRAAARCDRPMSRRASAEFLTGNLARVANVF